MKIGIVTLPFHTNYGGILQAYALQKTLERLGHDAEMVDTRDPLGFDIRRIIGTKVVRWNTDRFIRRNIKCGGKPKEGRYDALVVGSDQVWREKYSKSLGKYFLDFAKTWNTRRVGYSISFGTDEWEFTQNEEIRYRPLAQLFDCVSVREDSAVALCKEHFGIDAVHTLDPTLLLTKEDYIALIGRRYDRKAPRTGIMCHIFDNTPEKLEFVKMMQQKLGKDAYWTHNRDIDTKGLALADRAQYPIEDWLRGFRDADFIITDSFHACVFSILFGKPFVAFGNAKRGLSRFESLLGSLGMEGHLISRAEDFDMEAACTVVDPERLDALRKESICYLTNALK